MAYYNKGFSKKSDSGGVKRFSNAQKTAYYSGMGYAVAHWGRKINFNKSTSKDSFSEGYKRGIQMMRRSANKYPLLKNEG